jgi:prepilin peptidase CpaA
LEKNMGPSPEVVTSAAVIASSVAAAAIDLRTRRVPNALTAATAAAGLAIAVTGVGSTGVIASIVGGLVGFALLLPGHIWTLLGPNKIIVAFLATAISGGLIALVIALLHRRFRNETFAYAPAIAVGAIVALWR